MKVTVNRVDPCGKSTKDLKRGCRGESGDKSVGSESDIKVMARRSTEEEKKRIANDKNDRTVSISKVEEVIKER